MIDPKPREETLGNRAGDGASIVGHVETGRILVETAANLPGLLGFALA